MRIFGLIFFILWNSIAAIFADDVARLSVKGTITWMDADQNLLILQDGSKAMAFRMDSLENLAPGQFVELEGQSSPFIAAFPEFPSKPSAREIRNSFEGPTNLGTYYLSRMRGFLHPPASGKYTFWIASDDSSELWISTNNDPANAKKIASVENGRWTNPREWDRFPTQQSRQLILEAGQSYYVEAVHQQSLGKDCLAVAWQGPGLAQSVIGGRYLFPSVAPNATLQSSERNLTGPGILWEYWTNCFLTDLSALKVADGSIRWLTDTRIIGKRPGEWPTPAKINPGQLLQPEQNFLRVEVEGHLTFFSKSGQQAEMELSDGFGRIRIRFKGDPAALGSLPDNSLVRVSGVCEAVRGEDGQLQAGMVWVNHPEDIVWSEADENWTSIKSMPMYLLSKANPDLVAGQWVRTRGLLVQQDTPGRWRVQGEDTFEGSSSTNGINWDSAGLPVEMMMNHSASMGFAVASHQTAKPAEIQFDHVSGLSGNLQGTDIGSPECSGTIRTNGTTYTVHGCGNGLWSVADECFFGWQPLDGDAEITAHISNFTSSNSEAKAGIMVRESVESDSIWAAMIFTPLNKVGLQARRETGKNAAGAISVQSATWLKLRRHQNTFWVQFEDTMAPQAGQKVELVGMLSWTNKTAMLSHAHYRDLASQPLSTAVNAPARQSSVGGLPDVRIKDLPTESQKAILAGRLARSRIRGTVTFNQSVSGKPLFIVQDDSGACPIQLDRIHTESTKVGQTIEVTGVPNGDGPEFRANGLAVLGEGLLPMPLKYPFAPAIKDQTNYRWVEAEGVGRFITADGRLMIMTSDGLLPVGTENVPADRLAKYINALLRVRGVYWLAETPTLLTPAEEFIEIQESAPANPFDIPTVSTANLQTFNPAPAMARRVKITGTVTCLREGYFLIQDKDGGAQVETTDTFEVKLGDTVEVAGFVSKHPSGLTLSQTAVRREKSGSMPSPMMLSMNDILGGYNNDVVVSLDAVVLGQRVLNGIQTLDLQAGQRAFRATLPTKMGRLPDVVSGCTVRITGVSHIESFQDVSVEANRRDEPLVASVVMLLRSPEDVVILKRPPWWNWKYTAAATAVPVVALLGTMLWVRTLRRRVEQRTNELRLAMVRLKKETQISATLAERDRLAGEIHDSVEQGLSAIMMQMEAAEKLVDQPEEMARYVAMARNMAGFSRTEVQHAVWNLQSPMLENVDLPTALRRVASDISAGDSPKVSVEVSGPLRPLSSAMEHHLLRIGQEALTNAVKHGHPKTIVIQISYEPEKLTFAVRDDGCGFNPDVPSAGSGHFGLLGIRTRAQKIDATISIVTKPNQGTTIQLVVPLGQANANPIL